MRVAIQQCVAIPVVYAFLYMSTVVPFGGRSNSVRQSLVGGTIGCTGSWPSIVMIATCPNLPALCSAQTIAIRRRHMYSLVVLTRPVSSGVPSVLMRTKTRTLGNFRGPVCFNGVPKT
jgi:hypothetical protein